MKAKNFLLQTICCVLIFTATCNAQYNYLPTKTVDISNTYFGVPYKDPYRRLIKSTLKNFSVNNATVVVPEEKNTITDISRTKDFMLINSKF